jgi:mediator of RNA polymerase II transcription subunit 12
LIFFRRLFTPTGSPASSNYTLTDRKFGLDYIANPRKPVDPLTVKLIAENPQNQYNLVCNILMEVCGCEDADKLNDIAVLCCEFTAQCNSLSGEWLAAFVALTNAGSAPCYVDLLQHVVISDETVYGRLGTFAAILIARHCFNLQSFLVSVAIPSLLSTWEQVRDDRSCSVSVLRPMRV